MLRFSKMHSLGNDFVVIDGVRQSLEITPALARRIADRHRGIGCDQLLVARPANGRGDFAFRIYNHDGSESAQCGNGARCFAHFLRRQGLTDASTIRVATHSTEMTLDLLAGDLVRVDMGAPVFEPARIPYLAEGDGLVQSIDTGHGEIGFVVLSMGNPHAVTVVDDVDGADVAAIGAAVERHPRFPERTNVGFAEVVDRGHLRLRVFERGVGETRACGSGACAAVVAGRQLGLLDASVRVTLPGGTLAVDYAGDDASVQLTGDAVHVYDGELPLG